MSDEWFDAYAAGEREAEDAMRAEIDAIGEKVAYCQGYADAIGRAAVAAGKEAERRYQDGFWQGFGEGLLSRPTPYRRASGRGLGRARCPRNLTRPPAARTVAR